MKKLKVNKLIKIFMFFLVPFVISCDQKNVREENTSLQVQMDINDIRERGRLIVVTDFNSVNYYIYKGQPLGFQYEMLQELSDHLGLPVEVKVNNDLQQNFNMLVKGEVDLIASNLTITSARREYLDFTIPHGQTRQVLVQQKKQNTYEKKKAKPLRNITELGGKTVYIQKSSVYMDRLKNLSEEIGEEILIRELPLSTEQLIKMVARGEIYFTIADENIAEVNQKLYPEIDVQTAVSFLQNQAWALRKDSYGLKDEIDKWLEDFKKTTKYAVLYHKYFISQRNINIVTSKFYYPETGRISYFDEVIKTESRKIGWDWRLLASMIYQESRFDHQAVSHAGAFGIMQFMPGTATSFGVTEDSTPEEQILAGVKYIQWLDKRFKSLVPDESERIKFILASYNIGLGHILDAIRLTEKYGRNPMLWEDNVEYYLLKKAEPGYYNDEVVKNGYCRGTETYHYVRGIFYRYNHYLNIENLALARISSNN